MWEISPVLVGNEARYWREYFFFFLTFFCLFLFLRISSFHFRVVSFRSVSWPWPPLFYASCTPVFHIQKFSHSLLNLAFPFIPLLYGGLSCLPELLLEFWCRTSLLHSQPIVIFCWQACTLAGTVCIQCVKFLIPPYSSDPNDVYCSKCPPKNVSFKGNDCMTF